MREITNVDLSKQIELGRRVDKSNMIAHLNIMWAVVYATGAVILMDTGTSTASAALFVIAGLSIVAAMVETMGGRRLRKELAEHLEAMHGDERNEEEASSEATSHG